MRTFVCWTLCGIMAMAAAGCRTGPKFNAREAEKATETPGPIQPAIRLQDNAFTEIEATNRVTTDLWTPSTNHVRLGPGDVVEVEMMGEAGETSVLPIGPDGKVYFSMLPGTFVWGLTISETKALLEQNLSRYLRLKPEVAVTLKTVGSRRMWILGSVAKPGVYSMIRPMPLIEAITVAGGIPTAGSQEIADLKNSFVMRDGQTLPVDFDRLLREGDLTQNIYLQPGDFIYVKPGVNADLYVLGAVASPNIVPFKRDSTLVQAISMVGGPVRYAYQSHVAIIRGSLQKPRIAIVNYGEIVHGKAPDIFLQAGDVIYVPFVPYQRLQMFAEQILGQFVRTLAINEGRNAVTKNARPLEISTPLGTP